MVSTLLLRLAGPMQAWGVTSRFKIRDTGLEPSKSGVVGLICAAMGRAREAPVDDLAGLRLGVRVDREGKLAVDYQTAGGHHLKGQPYGVARAGNPKTEVVTSSRYYLADADFLVGLSTDDANLLGHIAESLNSPRWQIFLGRKSYLPGLPVVLPEPAHGLRDGIDLETALRTYPWPSDATAAPRRDARAALRAVLETPVGQGDQMRPDQPIGAAFATRRFGPRWVRTEFWRRDAEIDHNVAEAD